MGLGSVNVVYTVKVNEPNGVAGLDNNALISKEQLPILGFVEMPESIPIGDRKENTLYGLVLVDFSAGDSA